MQKYYDAIRQTVCSICVDSNNDGGCKLSENEICAVEKHLNEIVDLVQKSDAKYQDEYYIELREKICTNCRGKAESGKCYLRDDANCALDRYFPLIVDTIRKIDQQSN